MRVSDVMSRNPRTVGDWEELQVPDDLVRFGRFRALPVLDRQGELVGMLARADLIEEAIPRGAARCIRVADVARPRPALLHDHADIEDAARLMLAHHAHTLPVVDHAGKTIGILTDSDLLAALSGRPAPVEELEEAEVSHVMSPNPATIDEGATLETAAQMMLDGGYRHLPVVDVDGNLTGIISERLLREKLGTNLRDIYHAAPEAKQDTVGNSMAPDPLTVRASAKLLDAIDLFTDERFTALPVLDDDDRLVGMLSYVDVLNWLRQRKRPMAEQSQASQGPGP